MTRLPLLSDAGDVLAQVAPGDDVEEGDLLLPLAGLAVLPAAVDGEAEAGHRPAGVGEAELGVAGDVARRG